MATHHSIRAGNEPIRIDVHIEDMDPALIREQIHRDLSGDPKRISSRFFYDDRGSELFEQICDLPEYYQTRTERAILNGYAREIMTRTGARELAELGSGAATKTRVLLDAMAESGSLERYLPFDVNEWIVRRTAEELTEHYPGLLVHGVIGDFMHHLHHIPDGNRRLIIFLGGTIGNLEPGERAEFLNALAATMQSGDCFLLGVDLIKDRGKLHAAYNDNRGITAAFNRNILTAVNEVCGGGFDPAAFDHHAFYNEADHRIEMWLRSRRAQTLSLPLLPMRLNLAEGEGILTEISTKFDRAMTEGMLVDAGLCPEAWYSDSEALFALALARKA